MKQLLYRAAVSRNGTILTRVLGGVQYDADDLNEPMRFYVGASCLRSGNTSGVESGDCCSVVEYSNTQWDTSNSLFDSSPIARDYPPGPFQFKREDTSMFTISWEWTGDDDGKAISAHGRRTEFVRLGKATLTLPLLSLIHI